MSSIITAQVLVWRQKVLDGTITPEEQIEAIAAIRRERVESHTTSATSRAKKATAKEKAAPIDSNGLLDELNSI